MRLVLLALSLLATPAPAAEPVTLSEWRLPWPDSRPRDPDVAPDGSVWFVGQVGNYLARLDPRTGAFDRVDLADGVHPHNLIIGRDGVIWYAGNRAAHIGRYDPATRKTTIHAMPNPKAADPHTLVFDGRGGIWFTVQRSNYIGRLSMADGKIALRRITTPNALPYGIVAERDGRAWAVLFGAPKLASVDPATLAIEEIALPRTDARPRRIARTSDGRIWYVDHRGSYLGAYDPQSRSFREWPTPSPNAAPYAMAVDHRGWVWFVESGVQPNRLVAFDPFDGRYAHVEVIDSRTVRHMVFHAPTRSLWFGTDNDKIVRATLAE
jgi:virginiamycin B lyase